MTLVIRPAVVDDLSAAVSLLRGQALPVDGFADIIRAHPEHVLLAEFNDAVVGSAAIERLGEVALLRSVAVARDLVTLGIGSRLVTDMIDLARRNGVHTLYLLTTTAADWFPRFGFVRCERSEVAPSIAATVEFTKACPASAIAMRCELVALTERS